MTTGVASGASIAKKRVVVAINHNYPSILTLSDNYQTDYQAGFGLIAGDALNSLTG